MRLYHRTTAENAASILRDGFKDATRDYGLRDEAGEPILQTGVWLSDVPLHPSEGARGSTLLEVTVEAGDGSFDAFEWIEEGKPYREWLIHAAVLNPLTIGIRAEKP